MPIANTLLLYTIDMLYTLYDWDVSGLSHTYIVILQCFSKCQSVKIPRHKSVNHEASRWLYSSGCIIVTRSTNPRASLCAGLSHISLIANSLHNRGDLVHDNNESKLALYSRHQKVKRKYSLVGVNRDIGRRLPRISIRLDWTLPS